MSETPEPPDAADALAVALCHVQAAQFRARLETGTSRANAAQTRLDATPRRCRAAQEAVRLRASNFFHPSLTMMRVHCQLRWLRLLLFTFTMVAVPASYAAPGAATITYRRVFNGSTPEFIEIKVSDQGKCTFDIRQLEEDADAQPFEVGPAVRQKIFELAAD